MSIERLRRVLAANYMVKIDSSADTVGQIIVRQRKRMEAAAKRRKPPPDAKVPKVVAALEGVPSFRFRAIDLLRKIGDLTTPSWVNMASLSASWATRRYFWAIAEHASGLGAFKLNREVSDLDFHQKTLLSDEFGIGMAGLAMEQLFTTNAAADVSVALKDAKTYQQIRRRSAAEPDYLMWDVRPGAPYYVVECKGSQSSRGTTLDQLRRGLEQVPSIAFGAGPRRSESLVIATSMRPTGTTVYIFDPPGEEDEEDSERVSERAGRSWKIRSPEEFSRRSWNAERSRVLKWAGLFQAAARVDAELESALFAAHYVPEVPLPDQPLVRREFEGVGFQGRSIPAFPELGRAGLSIFTGVEESVLEHLRSESGREPAGERPIAEKVHQMLVANQRDNHISVGPNGMCLAIGGL